LVLVAFIWLAKAPMKGKLYLLMIFSGYKIRHIIMFRLMENAFLILKLQDKKLDLFVKILPQEQPHNLLILTKKALVFTFGQAKTN